LSAAQSLLSVPFYFSTPKSAVDTDLMCQTLPYPSFWQESQHDPAVGLRVIAIPNGPAVAERKKARRKMGHALARSGHLKDGDIVLTFRPEMAESMAYPHIQMGITHAGLVYTRDDGSSGVTAFNIDSPMDHLYMGQFDSAHYAGDGVKDAGTDALHVIRPRGMTSEKRKNLRNWIKIIRKNLPRFNGERYQVKFQPDYMVPRYAAIQGTPEQVATKLGKILIEEDKRTKLPMFCSEFAYYMLALSTCSPTDIKRAGAEGASCVQLPFSPMPLTAEKASDVGMADGPLINLLALPQSQRMESINKVFCSNGYDCVNGAKLSRGHRTVAATVAPLMAGLEKIYQARAQGATVEMTAEGAQQLNAPVPKNYSPTAFFVRSMSLGARATDYVATILFIKPRDYQKARSIAKAQNAECEGKDSNVGAAVGGAQQCIKDAERVKTAQEHLISHGQSITADGAWGRRSLAALNAVQRKFNHKITDCLTEEAFELLGKAGAAPRVESSGSCSKSCIRRGERAIAAQEKLGVTADGIFGRGSTRALNKFQRENGHEVTECLHECALKKMGL
jgi:hypothetical protein